MFATASLNAHEHLKGRMTFCSSRAAGWRALLLRSYVDPPEVEDLVTAPTPDHKLVLVTAGSCAIESRRNGGWVGANYRAGHLGMVAPRDQAVLRWRGVETHSTHQVHLPAVLLHEAADDLGLAKAGFESLTALSQHDMAIASTILALERAARAGAPELYADVAARYLAVHVVGRGGWAPRPSARHAAGALRAVDEFMRGHLASPLTLAQLAAVAGIGRFQLLREAKIVWGETPMRRLTRLRMETARHLLLHSSLSVIEIALECGYGNPAHFSTAFKRHLGVAPSALRR